MPKPAIIDTSGTSELGSGTTPAHKQSQSRQADAQQRQVSRFRHGGVTDAYILVVCRGGNAAGPIIETIGSVFCSDFSCTERVYSAIKGVVSGFERRRPDICQLWCFAGIDIGIEEHQRSLPRACAIDDTSRVGEASQSLMPPPGSVNETVPVITGSSKLKASTCAPPPTGWVGSRISEPGSVIGGAPFWLMVAFPFSSKVTRKGSLMLSVDEASPPPHGVSVVAVDPAQGRIASALAPGLRPMARPATRIVRTK